MLNGVVLALLIKLFIFTRRTDAEWCCPGFTHETVCIYQED